MQSEWLNGGARQFEDCGQNVSALCGFVITDFLLVSFEVVFAAKVCATTAWGARGSTLNSKEINWWTLLLHTPAS